jgi:type II secretory pathway pseudopilin PulG
MDTAGFTALEAAVAVLALGMILVIAAPNLLHARAKADAAWALDQLRDVQRSAWIYFLDNGVAPDGVTLNSLYSGGDKSKSIVEKFKIVPVTAQTELGHPDRNANVPAHYVICSTMSLADVAYVYSYDDQPPQIARVGTDPANVGGCPATSAVVPGF